MSEESSENGVTRRGFLARSITGASGVMVVMAMGDVTMVSAANEAQSASLGMDSSYDPNDHSYVYLIDITKCIGCGACVRACEQENNVPAHHFRTWVERYMVSRSGEDVIDSPDGGKNGFDPVVTGADITKAFFVPKICNHCANSPCVQLCPVGASYRSPDGIVLVDEDRCIGCSYCVQACPYGSRFINPETHTASKCTLCYHRITKGLLPACVQACPTGARKFGDSKRLHDEVTELIATSQVRVLRPELYTEPNCYYLGMGKEVR